MLRCSNLLLRHPQRPLKRDGYLPRRTHGVQDVEGKNTQSSSYEFSSSLLLRGWKREWDCHAKRRYKAWKVPSPSSSPPKGSSSSYSSSSDGGMHCFHITSNKENLLITHGKNASFKDLTKEKSALFFKPVMVFMAQRIKYFHLFNNLMLHLVVIILQNH